MALLPNYGWVQNTSNLSTIRDTIDLVPENGITHLNLKEAIKKFREKHGGLPRRWSWDARCRIKAIHATGLVSLNRNIEGYELTDLGRRLKNAPKSDNFFNAKRILTNEEKEIFKEGILTNPPVIRVLKLLYENYREGGTGLTKYDLGAQLGFAGDVGFTHHDPYWVARNGYSFSNKEGDADKWARTIVRWLMQVEWADYGNKIEIEGKGILPYQVNRENIDEIEKLIRYTIGRTTKNVPIEMLCSQHHPFPNLIKKRRSLVLRILSERDYVTVSEIVDYLKNSDINIEETSVEFEIINLRQAGLKISEYDGNYTLDDKINLDAPAIEEEVEEENEIEQLIEEYVVKCSNTIPSLLVDGLIRYGYSGDSHNEFEEKVGEYFRFLGYEVEDYGQGAGAVADCLVKYKHEEVYAHSYGIIVDAKATNNTYAIPTGDRRSMKEYIATHGPELLGEGIPKHAFSFVTSKVIENPENNLEEISNDTAVDGTAIEVLELLELGKEIINQDVSINSLYPSFTTNTIFKVPE